MQIDKETIQKIEALKELVLAMVNSRLIPLRKQMEQLDDDDFITKAKLSHQLHEVEKELTLKYDELVELNSKYGLFIETTMSRYKYLN